MSSYIELISLSYVPHLFLSVCHEYLHDLVGTGHFIIDHAQYYKLYERAIIGQCVGDNTRILQYHHQGHGTFIRV